MYKVKYLQEELTSLFRTRILEDGNPAEDAMDYLGNIDFHALTQAVQDKARTAYTYITQGMQEKSFNYRGPELFGQKATLLYVEDDQSTMEIAVTTRTLYRRGVCCPLDGAVAAGGHEPCLRGLCACGI